MEPLALTGATVVDVVAGAHTHDAVVLIEGTRISAVEPMVNADIPAHAERIDASGQWILPGLIDMHAHVTMHHSLPLELFLANGVTSIRDPAGRATEQRLLRESIAGGTRLGPRMFIAGEVLDGTPPVWPNASLLIDTPQQADAAARHLAAQGMDCLKIYNHVPETSLRVVLEVASELGKHVIGHVPRALSMRRAVELGMRGLEHIRITARDFLPEGLASQLDALPVGEREPRLWEHIDLDAPWLSDLIAMLAETGTYLDPTMVIDEVLYGDGLEAQRDHPDNRCLPENLRMQARPVPGIMNVPAGLRALAADCVRKRREFVGRCSEAGVVLLAGTDGTGFGKLLPGFGLHHELSALRAAGLSGLEALQAATVNAARALGMRDTLGSVEPGKTADLLVSRVDPLTAHLTPGDLTLVLQAGQRHRPEALLAAAGGAP